MTSHLTRRGFLAGSLGATATLAFGMQREAPAAGWFKISLAQWSLHKAFFGRSLDPKNFAKIAKEDFGIAAIEYVNQFYKPQVGNKQYLTDLKKLSSDCGVTNLLIMCDGEGRLGDPDEKARKQAVDNHKKWIDWAKFLGCHSIRVNAASAGSYDEQIKLAADGLRKLTEVGAAQDINVIVENHGGLSSDGQWLASVMKTVDHPRCGTLPDFGNFNIGGGKQYDRYKGVQELMPFAKGVSAKSHDFNDQGDEIHTDYQKMMKIVKDANYRGYVGIEYEGSKLSEPEGIKATKKLLERVRAKLS